MKVKLSVGASMVVACVLGYSAVGAERTEAKAGRGRVERSDVVKNERPAAERQEPTWSRELLVNELEGLAKGMTVELAEAAYPAIYGFFQEQINAGPLGEYVTENTRQQTQQACETGCMRVIPTTGGVLTILETGDGAVHQLAVIFDREEPAEFEQVESAQDADLTRESTQHGSLEKSEQLVSADIDGSAEMASDIDDETREAELIILCTIDSTGVCCGFITDSGWGCGCCATARGTFDCGCEAL